MWTISASAARRTLSAQLERVQAGEEVAITRHGRVVAVLVHPDAVRQHRAADAWRRADHVAGLLERAHAQPWRNPTLTDEQAAALITTVRAGRDRR